MLGKKQFQMLSHCNLYSLIHHPTQPMFVSKEGRHERGHVRVGTSKEFNGKAKEFSVMTDSLYRSSSMLAKKLKCPGS